MKISYLLIGAGFLTLGAAGIVLDIKTVKNCSGKTVGKITGVHESEGRDRENYRTRFRCPWD